MVPGGDGRLRAAAFGLGLAVGAAACWVAQRLGQGVSWGGWGAGGAVPVEYDDPSTELRVIRKAETVLRKRTSRIILVLERCTDPRNNQAVMRTMEALGIQHVWEVLPVQEKVPSANNKFEKGDGRSTVGRSSLAWLTLRSFKTTAECIRALRDEGVAIWATDLSQQATPLDARGLTPPERVAIVIGRESDGVSEEMLRAADRRVYLPLYGFTESLNQSVAAALVVQRVLALMGDRRGELPVAEARALREHWFGLLSKTPRHWEAYRGHIDDPPEPLGDLRVPEAFRTPYVKKKIRRRQEREEKELMLADGGGEGGEVAP